MSILDGLLLTLGIVILLVLFKYYLDKNEDLDNLTQKLEKDDNNWMD